jgi:hypothetical protein
MRTTTITRVTAILLALSAAACTAQAQRSAPGRGSVDTRTAQQFDDYNPAIKPPVDDYDMGGAATNKNASTQYTLGSAQSLAPLPGMIDQDKR